MLLAARLALWAALLIVGVKSNTEIVNFPATDATVSLNYESKLVEGW
jgi:hypothetical protein